MKKNLSWRAAFFGFLSGILFAFAGMLLLMPKMMIVVHKSRYNTVEETCKKLKESIESNGWSCPGIKDISGSIRKRVGNMPQDIRTVELCKASYAKDVLLTNPEMSTLMPCAWGVYKGKDGNVYISGMNVGLVGRLFGGNIAKIMGKEVAKEEQIMLSDVIED